MVKIHQDRNKFSDKWRLSHAVGLCVMIIVLNGRQVLSR